MSHTQEFVSLPEDDYGAVLDVITELLSHQTAHSLAGLFHSHLLPLLDASTFIYACADADFLKPRILEAVGVPQSDLNSIQAYFAFCPLIRQMVDRSSLVETYDLDIPRSKLHESVAGYFEAHPAGRKRNGSFLDDIRTTLLTIDRSEPAIAIGFHRLDDSRESFTRREKRILELLRPHLCQAIRTFVLKEGSQYSTDEEHSLNSQTPTAQVTRDSRIIDQNPQFRKLFNSLPGDKLGSSLTRFLECGVSDYEVSPSARSPVTEASLYCLCPRVFQVDVIRRNDDLWLLELHKLSGACPGFNPVLKQYGLTPKEKEVCCRVRQGFDNREIASQLFISFHTAKTHLKNIYGKLDIPNRPRLVSFLNKE